MTKRTIEQIRNESKKFNLKEVFLKKSENEIASVVVITPEERINSLVEKTHVQTINEIFSAIDSNYKNEEDLEKLAKAKGSIIVTVISTFQIFYMPSEINDSQYDELEKLVKEYEEIEKELGKEFGVSDTINHSNASFKKLLDAAKAMIKSKQRNIDDDWER